MTNHSAMSAFVPRTVASVERISTALVARFAGPVRALAARTVGFVDRIVGAHLWSLDGAPPSGPPHDVPGSLPVPAVWPEEAVPAAAGDLQDRSPGSDGSRSVAGRRGEHIGTARGAATARALLAEVASSLPGAGSHAAARKGDRMAASGAFSAPTGGEMTGPATPAPSAGPAGELASLVDEPAPAAGDAGQRGGPTHPAARPPAAAPAVASGVARPGAVATPAHSLGRATPRSPVADVVDAPGAVGPSESASQPATGSTRATAADPAGGAEATTDGGDLAALAPAEPDDRAGQRVAGIGRSGGATRSEAALPTVLRAHRRFSVGGPLTSLGRPLARAAWVEEWLARVMGAVSGTAATAVEARPLRFAARGDLPMVPAAFAARPATASAAEAVLPRSAAPVALPVVVAPASGEPAEAATDGSRRAPRPGTAAVDGRPETNASPTTAPTKASPTTAPASADAPSAAASATEPGDAGARLPGSGAAAASRFAPDVESDSGKPAVQPARRGTRSDRVFPPVDAAQEPIVAGEPAATGSWTTFEAAAGGAPPASFAPTRAALRGVGFVPSLWAHFRAAAGLTDIAASVPGELAATPAVAGTAAGAFGVLGFVDRLAGWQAARDGRVLPIVPLRPIGQPVGLELVRGESPPAVRRAASSARPADTGTGRGPTRVHAAANEARAGGTASPAADDRQAIDSTGAGPSATSLRPGSIGARAEQVAAWLGLQAAGITVEFVDPAKVPDLIRTRTALSRTLVALPGPTDGFAGSRDAVRGERAAPAGTSTDPPSAFAAALEAAPAVEAAAFRHRDEGPGTTGGSDASPVATDAWTAGSATGAARAEGMPAALRAVHSVLARKAHEAWALASLFPGAARSLLSASRWQEVWPLVAAAAREGATSPAAPDGALARVAPGASRPLLPDGRMPRGSFTWPRAAGFAVRLGEAGDFTRLAAALSARAGGEAAAGGQAPWGLMPPVATEAVRRAFADNDATGTPTGPAPGGAPRLTAFTGGRAGGPAGEGGASATGGRARASGAPVVAARDELPGGSELVAPLLRALVSGATAAGPSSGSRSWAPPGASADPVVPAQATSEATTRMVEALRTQQHTGSDDRVTLADLTLVAVASATQQMAASSASPSGSAPRASATSGGGGDRGGGGPPQPPDPESERRLIDDLAREVVEEVRHQFRVAHERSGRTWES